MRSPDPFRPKRQWANLSCFEIYPKANESAGGMRQEFLMMSGVTKADRHQVTAGISDAISATGGWGINHTLFSNIAATIQFSLPSQRLDEFLDRIIAVSIKLDDDSIGEVQAVAGKHSPKPIDITASLNIAFIHNEPDLRREIPAVPG